jgi:hypothetical protein
MANANEKQAVLVTTEHRGVFMGYATAEDLAESEKTNILTLEDARLCIYWSSDVKGFMGLASHGPSSGCRIGPKACIRVRKITAILTVTPEAEAAWDAAPWSS